MKITPQKLKELKEIASNATPGPWEIRYRDLDNHEKPKVWAETYGWLITEGDLPRSHHNPSMKHIAAMNPETTRALIECLERAIEMAMFYADKRSWCIHYMIPITPISESRCIDRVDVECIPAKDGSHECSWGGKCAREFLKGLEE